MDAVDAFDLKAAKINERGTGSAQDPPRIRPGSAQDPPATMLFLLIYGYATGGFVSDAPNDKEQLVPIVGAISPAVGDPANILADNGYDSGQAVTEVEKNGDGPTVYAAFKRQHHGRPVADLEEKGDPPAPHLPGAGIAEIMAHRLETAIGKGLYKLRKETVEPLFGIVKEVLGFRRFSMRGKEKANIEWDLVSLSVNVKRLHKLGMTFPTA